MSRHLICPVCFIMDRKSDTIHEDYMDLHLLKEHDLADLFIFSRRVMEDCYHEGKFYVEEFRQ